jgi:hypothetical protein
MIYRQPQVRGQFQFGAQRVADAGKQRASGLFNLKTAVDSQRDWQAL